MSNVNIDNHYLIPSREWYDDCEIASKDSMNKSFYEYQIQSFNDCNVEQNIVNNIKNIPPIINFQQRNMTNGYTPTCNIDDNSKLTRGSHIVSKSANKLLTKGRTPIVIDATNSSLKFTGFLINGMLKNDPNNLQIYENKQGISSRNYNRKAY